MGVIKINGVTYGGGDNSVMLTQAEYNALVDAGTVDPHTTYFITDRSGEGGQYAANVLYDNNNSGLSSTNVQSALDEIVDDIGENIPATKVNYDNTSSVLASTNVQTAIDEVIDRIYPVGSIYLSLTDSDASQVAARFGGTWEAFGAGRTLVGYDSTQTEFATIGGTGGEKSHTLTSSESGVPAHNHEIPKHGHTYTSPTVSSSGAITNGITGGSHSHTTKVRLHNGGSSTSTGYYGVPYQMYTGNVYDQNGAVTSLGATQAVSVQNNTSHSHNLPNHSHTLSGGSVADKAAFNSNNNTASNASSAHNNLQPYITIYMYKRTA